MARRFRSRRSRARLAGKNEARRLRASGSTPAVVYGAGKEPLAVAVNPKEVERILHSKTGHNTIFTWT